MAHAPVASSKQYSYGGTSVVGDSCLVIHDHNRPVNVYGYIPKGGNKSAKTVDVTVGYQDS